MKQLHVSNKLIRTFFKCIYLEKIDLLNTLNHSSRRIVQIYGNEHQ